MNENLSYVTFDIQSIEHFIVGFLQIGRQFEFGLLRCHVALHCGICVVDNRQKHIQQDEKDEEYVGQEEDRTKNSMRSQNG